MSETIIPTVDVAGLQVHSTTKRELLASIDSRISTKQQTSVITPYSEFLYEALINPISLALYNRATFRIVDGVGVIWASKFLSIPLTFKSYYGKAAQAFWQMVYSGAAIIFNPKFIYKHFPEKIVGADLFWDLAELAANRSYKLYLLGAQDNIAEQTAKILKNKFPNIHIVGVSNKHWQDPSIINDVKQSGAEMIFVAFSPPKQERWVIDEFPKTGAMFAIGLGGTFDYIVGNKLQPPRFIRAIGLEWLHRLITQPKRVKRIWRAVVGLITALIRYKVFSSMPYRENVVIVISNSENKVLVCQRNPNGYAYGSGRKPDATFDNYWQFPQGGIDSGEDVLAGARREAVEETGLENLEYQKTQTNVNKYSWNNARRALLFNPLKYRGQMQSIVYFQHVGSDDAVKLDTHNNEFVAYRWVDRSELGSVLHEERRNIAEIVVQNI